jgi:hypothetical protein
MQPPAMTFSSPSLDSVESLAILCLFGVFAHVFALRKGEWDMWTMRFICAWITYEAVTPCALNQLRPMAYFNAIFLANKWMFSFLLGMTSSILIYRGFFHRLNRFPGPFVARLSNVYASWLAIKEEHMYLEVQKLHRKYGDIVRIGKSMLQDTKAHVLLNADKVLRSSLSRLRAHSVSFTQTTRPFPKAHFITLPDPG